VVTGVYCRVAVSGDLCEGEQLQEVVGDANHGPLGTHFLDAAQQELAEAACLFDLSEHRFHHLLSQLSITAPGSRTNLIDPLPGHGALPFGVLPNRSRCAATAHFSLI
jgi:hypothetical protein